jgi:hypothetical protein
MVTDGRMTEMLTNLIANLRALRMEHYLVLASDAAVCTTLVAGGEVHGCAWSSALDADRAAAQQAWGVGAGKEGLWWLRWYTMASLGKLGLNVLSTDADVYFHANPYPTLKVMAWLCKGGERLERLNVALLHPSPGQRTPLTALHTRTGRARPVQSRGAERGRGSHVPVRQRGPGVSAERHSRWRRAVGARGANCAGPHHYHPRCRVSIRHGPPCLRDVTEVARGSFWFGAPAGTRGFQCTRLTRWAV